MVQKGAKVCGPTSGRTHEALTDQPRLHFFTYNFLDGSEKGKNGGINKYSTGLALEAQLFPNSPNGPSF